MIKAEIKRNNQFPIIIYFGNERRHFTKQAAIETKRMLEHAIEELEISENKKARR